MTKPKFRLYNTMTKQKEVFEPLDPPNVGMYVCGVTAYDYAHIGHARAYVAFDVLHRYLNHLGYNVNYVRNFTDVDDKIIRRANESGEHPLSLSNRFCEEFSKDMKDLGCLSPKEQPRVSVHIDEIESMIQEIQDKGFAYHVEGDVYFEVDKFPEYGRLSGRRPEDNRAGERVSVDSRKKNPADFALWKSAKPDEEVRWESPWGHGRPGWHIECSAMSRKYLGDAFDIHGGGQDLIFPHHENEIAQSHAACEKSNVEYWLHNGFVNVNDEKMSKSLGNFFTIREVFSKYHPLALRYFLMTTHYRSPVNYSTNQLDNASYRLCYIFLALADCEMVLSQFREGELPGKIENNVQMILRNFRSKFDDAMADDLHTPPILSSFPKLVQTMNRITASLLAGRVKQDEQEVAVQNLFALEKEMKDVLRILGLLPPEPTTMVEALQELKAKGLERAKLTEEEVQKKIEDRNSLKEKYKYEEDEEAKEELMKAADNIRTELEKVGIGLMDNTPQGTVWKPIPPNPHNDCGQSSGTPTDAK